MLRDAIATHSPEYVESKVSEKTLKSWSVVIDRMLRLDKSEAGQIEAVIRFAHINDKTEFWRSNLMSGVSLRKQFHRLLVQCRKKGLLNPHATEADWKTEYGTWAIRIAERSLITTGSSPGLTSSRTQSSKEYPLLPRNKQKQSLPGLSSVSSRSNSAPRIDFKVKPYPHRRTYT